MFANGDNENEEMAHNHSLGGCEELSAIRLRTGSRTKSAQHKTVSLLYLLSQVSLRLCYFPETTAMVRKQYQELLARR